LERSPERGNKNTRPHGETTKKVTRTDWRKDPRQKAEEDRINAVVRRNDDLPTFDEYFGTRDGERTVPGLQRED